MVWVYNMRGRCLVDVCYCNHLVITNTISTQHPICLHIWRSPDSVTKNQINYVMIQGHWR